MRRPSARRRAFRRGKSGSAGRRCEAEQRPRERCRSCDGGRHRRDRAERHHEAQLRRDAESENTGTMRPHEPATGRGGPGRGPSARATTARRRAATRSAAQRRRCSRMPPTAGMSPISAARQRDRQAPHEQAQSRPRPIARIRTERRRRHRPGRARPTARSARRRARRLISVRAVNDTATSTSAAPTIAVPSVTRITVAQTPGHPSAQGVIATVIARKGDAERHQPRRGTAVPRSRRGRARAP